MKKILVMLFAVLAFAGCSGSDDDSPNAELGITGKWVQTYYRNSSTGSFIGQEDGTYFVFNADGSFVFFYSGWGALNSTISGKYVINGSASLPVFLELEYENGNKAKVDVLSLDANGEATFVIDGLLYTGTYKFSKV